jgi:hypothetical protein
VKYVSPNSMRVLFLLLQLQQFVLDHFQCIHVTTIELHKEMVELQQYFKMSDVACEVETFENGTDEASHRKDTTTQPKEPCRSRVIIADAFKYVAHHAQKIAVKLNKTTGNVAIDGVLSGPTESDTEEGDTEEEDLYYDVILVDVYDSAATRWNGEPGHGVSNHNGAVGSSHENIQNIRQLLRPRSGMRGSADIDGQQSDKRSIAIIHLHNDASLVNYRLNIHNVFDSKHVVELLAGGSSSVFVATSDSRGFQPFVFPAGPINNAATKQVGGKKGKDWHPCDHVTNFTLGAIRFGRYHKYPANIQYASTFILNC